VVTDMRRMHRIPYQFTGRPRGIDFDGECYSSIRFSEAVTSS
jgi:hypothetical protein